MANRHEDSSAKKLGQWSSKNRKRDLSCTYTGHSPSHYWECGISCQLSVCHLAPHPSKLFISLPRCHWSIYYSHILKYYCKRAVIYYRQRGREIEGVEVFYHHQKGDCSLFFCSEGNISAYISKKILHKTYICMPRKKLYQEYRTPSKFVFWHQTKTLFCSKKLNNSK